jgi:hypothetical protein
MIKCTHTMSIFTLAKNVVLKYVHMKEKDRGMYICTYVCMKVHPLLSIHM